MTTMKRLFIYLILACTALTAWGQSMNELLQKANAGDAQAQYELGYAYYFGANGCEKDYAKAFKWYSAAAKQGHAKAQFGLGGCYSLGRGVDKDYEQQVYWYKKAAEHGLAEAQTALGECYMYGDGVPLDKKEAEKWFIKAAKQGDEYACLNLGNLYKTDDKKSKAISYFKKHQDLWLKKYGEVNVVVYNILKEMEVEYNPGPPLSSPNNNMASRQESADSQTGPTDPVDQYNLGVDYYQKKDYDKAVYWFEKAAEQGIVEALYNLGVCYANGEGVSQDYTTAAYWYEKAAEQGYAKAQLNLGHLYFHYNGVGVKFDWEKALYWYEKAALQGNAKAQTQTGLLTNLYIKDYEKAKYWLEKAAAQGEKTAIEMLELLKKYGND